MRKSISLLLCFTLLVVICVVKSDDAYGENVGLGSYGKEVRVKTTGVCETVYKVDISWGDMNFVYATTGSSVWNEKTHLFEQKFKSTWTGTDNYIKLVNHSNTEVDAKFTYVNKGIHTGVIGTFEGGNKLSLPSAEGKPLDSKEIVGSKNLLLDGVLSNTLEKYIKLGAVNIQIE